MLPRRKSIRIQANDGTFMHGSLAVPENALNHLVIFTHGYLADSSSGFWPSIQERTTKAGIPNIAFDLRGCGRSDGPWSYGGYLAEVDDIAATIRHLFHSQADCGLLFDEGDVVQKRGITIVGHSRGGDDVLLFPHKYPNVVTQVINISGRLDLSRGVEEQFGSEKMNKLLTDPLVEVKVGKELNKIVNGSGLNDRMIVSSLLMGKGHTRGPALEALITHLSSNEDLLEEVVTIHAPDDNKVPYEDGLKIHELLKGTGRSHFRSAPPSCGHSFKDDSSRKWLADEIILAVNRIANPRLVLCS